MTYPLWKNLFGMEEILIQAILFPSSHALVKYTLRFAAQPHVPILRRGIEYCSTMFFVKKLVISQISPLSRLRNIPKFPGMIQSSRSNPSQQPRFLPRLETFEYTGPTFSFEHVRCQAKIVVNLPRIY